MAVGKISGAVGNASHLGPEIEERICKRLGLAVAPVASQVIQRDRHAQYVSSLALIAATLEKIALEIRHLQRTEVREAEEPFGGEQRGSSAMPHKRNPVTCEQICGLARVVRSNMIAAFENVALWHERDISHSSVERIILPDSTILVDYMLAQNDHHHRRDARVSRAHAAQPGVHPWSGLLRPAAAGLDRKGHASRRRLQSRAGKRHGRVGNATPASAIAWPTTRASRNIWTPSALAHTFDLQRQLRYVDAIFDRVFGAHPAGEESTFGQSAASKA